MTLFFLTALIIHRTFWTKSQSKLTLYIFRQLWFYRFNANIYFQSKFRSREIFRQSWLFHVNLHDIEALKLEFFFQIIPSRMTLGTRARGNSFLFVRLPPLARGSWVAGSLSSLWAMDARWSAARDRQEYIYHCIENCSFKIHNNGKEAKGKIFLARMYMINVLLEISGLFLFI